VNFVALKIEGIKGRGLKAVKSLLLLPLSFLKSFVILLRLRPGLVIGAGGYSSGPVVLLASMMKIPTLILEQNLYPGFTNRLLIPWVRQAVVSFKSSLPSFKGKVGKTYSPYLRRKPGISFLEQDPARLSSSS
jgi:UDP-N-acetylglucosamine--N-acetylmuramyl-(pentapeptide) pyrophosphoryl-undecaprenol N-acetylglucosamine transferase